MQFKFIASDEYFEGDNGTGGSIIEAAIDNFNVIVFEASSCNDMGDVNGDLEINVLDAVSIINYILEGNDSFEVCAADINDDQIINVLDIVLLVNIILS